MGGYIWYFSFKKAFLKNAFRNICLTHTEQGDLEAALYHDSPDDVQVHCSFTVLNKSETSPAISNGEICFTKSV